MNAVCSADPVHHFRIADDHACLAGHFPGRPLVPGVVLLDELAQALRQHRGLRITRVTEAKFLAPLKPGIDAEIHVQGESPRCRFEIRTGQTMLARGRIEVGA